MDDGSWECIDCGKVVNWVCCVANPGDTEPLLNGLLSVTVEVLEGVNEDCMVCWDKCGWNWVPELIESNGFGTFVVVGDWKNGFWWGTIDCDGSCTYIDERNGLVSCIVDVGRFSWSNLVALGSDYFDLHG